MLDADFLASDGGDAFGKKFVFRDLNSFVEGFMRVVVEDGDGLLGDDRAGINAGINEMDGAASDFYAMIEGLFPGFEAGKGGKK